MDLRISASSICRRAGTESHEEIRVLTLDSVYSELAPTHLHNNVSTYDLFIT
jgi:hypothetical protein